MLPNDFWEQVARNAREATAELIMATLLAGAAGGIELMPGALQQLVSWDVLNTQVLEFIRQYQFDLISGITATTRRQVSGALDAWVRSGDALPVLEAQLETVFGKVRAEMIASTEVTRAYAEGNMMAWDSTGLIGARRWNTANDERVCPICGPLHNQTALMNVPFVSDSGEMHEAPPAHIRCRCWLTPIVSEDMLREQIRGQFSADAVIEELKAAGVAVA